MKYRKRLRTGGDLSHYRGYLTWAQSQREAVRMPPNDTLAAMTHLQRREYDETRQIYLSRGMTVATRTVNDLDATVVEQMDTNFAKRGGGHGIFLSAPSGAGKTTSLHRVLGAVLADLKQDDPELLERGEVPVGYVCIPALGTPRSVYQVLADYLGIDYTVGVTEAELSTMVRNGINLTRMELLAIDEVQNLDNAANAGSVADALRRLGDDVDATIILAGIDLEHTSITTGRRGAQIANRFRRAAVYDYADDTQEDWRKHWLSLVGGMAAALPLHASDPREIVKLSTLLFDITRGSVGMLNSALTQIARRKISEGDLDKEQVTAEDLDRIALTLQAERHRVRVTPGAKTSGKKAPVVGGHGRGRNRASA
ncbi:ATP-binding protein [Arthrobacter sp. DNA4]|uniref:ATP-binding protein n=1 Tax=Arthrobacter sp. DNA4 TaxID=2963432 RepID=UPI0020CE2D40|nr:ATP-binding protein [Arthrobacter sp. DNA4]UTT68028.1 ATP-binding protein [Arthrobacter sp. DNA4]